MSGALFGMDDVRGALPATPEEPSLPRVDAGPRRPWWRRLMLGRAAQPVATPNPAPPVAAADPPAAATAVARDSQAGRQPAAAEPPAPALTLAVPQPAQPAADAALGGPPSAPPALQARTPWAVRLDPARGAAD